AGVCISYSYATSLSFLVCLVFFFFFNGPPPAEIYTLSLHDALPILVVKLIVINGVLFLADIFFGGGDHQITRWLVLHGDAVAHRSEEHTSELQSLAYLVCRLLLEKKKYRV